MGRFRDLTGQKFNRLVAVERAENKGKQTMWLCECDCGNKKVVGATQLTSGKTGSCGCLNRDSLIARNTKHGMSRVPEYQNWSKIKDRCLNPNCQDYKDYGAKGITIQESWVNDFMAFYNYIGPRPSYETKYSVDRIDRTRGYEEGNVRWADDATQSRNRGMQSSNTSGYTGVAKMCVKGNRKKGTNDYWQARWRDLDGNPRTKQFSVSQHGDELAQFLAQEYRELMIMRQQQIAGNYAADFGK